MVRTKNFLFLIEVFFRDENEVVTKTKRVGKTPSI